MTVTWRVDNKPAPFEGFYLLNDNNLLVDLRQTTFFGLIDCVDVGRMNRSVHICPFIGLIISYDWCTSARDGSRTHMSCDRGV